MQQRIADLGTEGPAEAALHPRLEELRDMYGDMAIRPSRSATSESATLGEQLLDIGIVHTGMPCQETRLSRIRACLHVCKRAGSY